MHRFFTFLGIIGFVFLTSCSFSQRSSKVLLNSSGHSLTYTVAWGLGMEERLTLTKTNEPRHLASSEWMEIWKKPYNSGAVVYVSDDTNTYYLGTYLKLGIVKLEVGALTMTCDKTAIPELTAYGKSLVSLDWKSKKKLDPGAPKFPSYVEEVAPSTSLPALLPQSKYYVGLKYLGRFGVVRGDGRGSTVGFVSSSKSAEPRLALNTHCG